MTFFDDVYAKRPDVFSKERKAFILKLPGLLPQGATVLDLGSGPGDDALFLAKRNLNVTCVDCSKVAIDLVKKRAKEERLNIICHNCDALDFEPKQQYNVVMSIGLVHRLENKKRFKEHILKMKEWVKPGGYNIVYLMINEGEFFKQKKDLLFLKDKEILGYYTNWKIRDFRKAQGIDVVNEEVSEENGNIIYNLLIAQKPFYI